MTILTTDGPAPDVAVATESSSSAVSWGPIIAGALAASTLTLILMLLGSGLGLTMVSPWSNEGASVTTFAVSTAIWLVVVAALVVAFLTWGRGPRNTQGARDQNPRRKDQR